MKQVSKDESESESLMSESLTANPITPYAQVSTPPQSNSYSNTNSGDHDSFSDNPVPRSASSDGYSSGSNDSEYDNDDDDDDDDDHDDDDDCDDDCFGDAANQSQTGATTPPANGLFSPGSTPQVQSN
jgi:hypothetical protein